MKWSPQKGGAVKLFLKPYTSNVATATNIWHITFKVTVKERQFCVVCYGKNSKKKYQILLQQKL